VRDVDRILAPLLPRRARAANAVIVFSEYGNHAREPRRVSQRRLREAGMPITVRDEGGGEIRDPVNSRAFAVG